ncbi:MAG: FAD-binding oxidoreductase, partial [Acidimicrobiia bacterium]|nr:FAD-binding oxidoreductase [Acidimicrobiia bacterium]
MTIKPTAPIEFSDSVEKVVDRIDTTGVDLSPDFLVGLQMLCPSSTSTSDLVEHARDWWPLTMHWSLNAMTARRPGVVCRPTSTKQVSDVVALCAKHSVPVTVSGGRSGVCGAAVPLFAGVVIDTTDLCGVVSVDQISGLIEVLPG